jgi:hypothetical protein
MIDPDLKDLVDLVDDVTDIDLSSSSLGGLRHQRPILYYSLLIGIVVVLAVVVYLLLW